MTGSVLARTLVERRRWALGVAALAALIAVYWPAVRDSPELQSFTRDLPEAMRALIGEGDYATASGFLNAELFAFMMPLLFLIVAVGFGAGTTTREEERGTIDVLLSTPLTRRRLLAEKLLGGVLVLAALGAVLFVALLLGGWAVDLGIGADRLAAVSLAVVLIALPFGALALLIACATGSHGLALGLASTAAVAAYMLDALAPLIDSLHGWQDLSPFAWYASDEVLAGGLALGNSALLLGSAALLAAGALLAFDCRDLGT